MSYMFEYSDFDQCLSTWAEKTPNDVDTYLMFDNTGCPGESNPLPEVGPWCQTEAQYCGVTNDDECANNPNFYAIKPSKPDKPPKNCEDFLKKDGKPLKGSKLQDKCKKSVETTKLGEVKPKNECKGICDEECICRDDPTFVTKDGEDCDALFVGITEPKKINKKCDEKVELESGGDKKKISKFCASYCKEECQPPDCTNKANIKFKVEDDDGEKIKQDCDELLSELNKDKQKKKCDKKLSTTDGKKKVKKVCPGYCKSECKNQR